MTDEITELIRLKERKIRSTPGKRGEPMIKHNEPIIADLLALVRQQESENRPLQIVVKS